MKNPSHALWPFLREFRRVSSCLRELVAQSVEQRPFKAWVLGSSPSQLTFNLRRVILKEPKKPRPVITERGFSMFDQRLIDRFWEVELVGVLFGHQINIDLDVLRGELQHLCAAAL